MADAPATDAAEIEGTLKKLAALLADPNVAVRTLYTEDAILMNGGPPFRGRAEILAREDVPALHDVVIRPESIEVQGGLASVFWHFSRAFTDPEAGRAEPLHACASQRDRLGSGGSPESASSTMFRRTSRPPSGTGETERQGTEAELTQHKPSILRQRAITARLVIWRS
jgi:hypothetical protein